MKRTAVLLFPLVREVYAKSVLNRHRRRDDWFLDDYSLNPYKGCDFNCVYCYIHGSRYGGDTLEVKVNAHTLLEKELRRGRKGEYGLIALSSATEPWMHLEERYKITRKCLRIIARYRFPVHCLTKSTLILRDLDVLHKIDDEAILPDDLNTVRRGVLVTFSFSTLDYRKASIFEPGAPPPEERLGALRSIIREGFKAGIAFMPVLPFISDDELEDMVHAAKKVGAEYAFFSPPTLQGRGKELYLSTARRFSLEAALMTQALYERSWFPKDYADDLYKKVNRLSIKYDLPLRIL